MDQLEIIEPLLPTNALLGADTIFASTGRIASTGWRLIVSVRGEKTLADRCIAVEILGNLLER